jgi:hypothetical protein
MRIRQLLGMALLLWGLTVGPRVFAGDSETAPSPFTEIVQAFLSLIAGSPSGSGAANQGNPSSNYGAASAPGG